MRQTARCEKATSAARKRGTDGRFTPVKRMAEKKGPAGGEAGQAAGVEEKALRPSQCRTHLRQELAKSFRGIVRGFVNQAESGSVQHLKLATELLDDAGKRRRGKGSAELLLERLRRVGEEPAKAESAADEDVWRE